MNLSMDVLRWLTVKSIRGRTWAGMRVFDSPGDPSNLRMEAEQAPFVAVYTDDADFMLEGDDTPNGGSLYDLGGTVMLVLEVAVAGQLQEGPPAPGPAVDADPSDPDIDRAPAPAQTVTLAATDEALEANIGFISRQALDALAAADNPWAELWRQLAFTRHKVEVRRGGLPDGQQEKSAFRYASRVLRLHIGVLAEPAPGLALSPGSFWSKLLDMADADAELSGVAGLIRAHLLSDAPAWRLAQQESTFTDAAVRAIGIGPPIQAYVEALPLLATVEATIEQLDPDQLPDA